MNWDWMGCPKRSPLMTLKRVCYLSISSPCRYVEYYGLDGPCDNVESVLKRIAQHLGKTSRIRVMTGTGELFSFLHHQVTWLPSASTIEVLLLGPSVPNIVLFVCWEMLWVGYKVDRIVGRRDFSSQVKSRKCQLK